MIYQLQLLYNSNVQLKTNKDSHLSSCAVMDGEAEEGVLRHHNLESEDAKATDGDASALLGAEDASSPPESCEGGQTYTYEEVLPFSPPLLCTVILAHHVTQAIAKVGFGKYQILLLLICGVAVGTEGMEIMLMGVLLPEVAKEWDLSEWMTASVGSIVFAGMFVGGFSWGTCCHLLCA